MDVNLHFWRREGQLIILHHSHLTAQVERIKTFFTRFRLWMKFLDPTTLLTSDEDVQKARNLLAGTDYCVENEKVFAAWRLSLTSVHPDTGAVLPFIFRPQAFLPIAAPLIAAVCLPHKGTKHAVFWQFLFQSYSAGFSYSNKNASNSTGEMSMKQAVLLAGTVTYCTCVGAGPQFALKWYRLKNPSVQIFFRSVLPVPILALLGAFSVFVVRGEELETGVKLFDSEGNPVGISVTAGWKAVSDTATSRAFLLGTTAALPHLFSAVLQRYRSFPLAAPLRHATPVIILGMMIPLSFSMFPQLGVVEKEKVEKEVQSETTERRLFYNRGI